MSKRPTSLPLQTKVSLALAVLIAAFIAISYGILGSVIAPAFDDLEQSAAEVDLTRARMAIRADIENLEAITADWAPWDDIYFYVLGEYPGFKKSNLDRPTLTNLGLDLMVVYPANGEYLWGQVLVDGKDGDMRRLGVLNPEHRSHGSLTKHSSAANRTVGFVNTGLGPMIISSRPILRSDDSGPVAGALIMGQFLDDARLQRLRDRTEVDMHWEFTAFGEEPEVASGAIGKASQVVSQDVVSSSMVLADIHGSPLLTLHADTPRSISSLGAHTINVALLFLAIAGVLATGFVWFMLHGAILRPIERLATHIESIRKSGDLSQRLDVQRGDEIGALAQQFDDLTDEVHEARQALLDQSFKAGKADTAAEVLHNIRNAMTPMINGLERLRKSFSVSDRLRVRDATEQLADPDCAPGRREKFVQYVNASFDHISEVGAEAAEDLTIVTKQARQIEGILADQERFANIAPITENIGVDDVLDEAAHIIPKRAKRDIEVELSRQLSEVRVCAHRIGLLQVMGNLILNAYESIQRCRKMDGRIYVDAVPEFVDDAPMVRVTIRDNGSGFNKDTGEKIFQRGYTSKEEGSTTGLGLHWCANAVAGMGGRIRAESRGLGQGAEFHVLLPAAQGG